MKRNLIKIAITFGLLMVALSVYVYADSPVTSINFSKAYMGNNIVQKADKSGKINQEIADYLYSPSNPLEIKAAVINALSWNKNGKNNAQLYAKLKYGKDIDKINIKKLSYDQMFCFGYMKLMDDYFNPLNSIYYLEMAKEKEPDSYVVNLILGIAKSQYAMSKDYRYVWTQVKKVFSNELLSKDTLSADATAMFYNYMTSYKAYEPDNSVKLDYGYENSSLVLRWINSDSTQIKGFNVLRKEAMSKDKPECLNKDIIQNNCYVDNSIKDGKIYVYFIQVVPNDTSTGAKSNLIVVGAILDEK